MEIDIAALKQRAKDHIGVDDLRMAPDLILDLIAKIESLDRKCEAMGRFISVCRLRKRNYLRATKWFMANTKVDLGEMPENIRLTLQSIVETMIAKAKKVTDKGKTDE
jgi:hypothetical protein